MYFDYICSNTLPRRGIHARPDEVLVTLGAQNALYIAVELLCRADRPAVTEEPGYPDIAETLRRWRDRFNGAWDDIAPMGFDERFHRMWNFYLASCAACFHAGTTDVTQVTLRRPA